jgi:hypothetical protein
MSRKIFFLIVLILTVFLFAYGERSFIGTPIETENIDTYVGNAGRSIIVFAGFNKNDEFPPFVHAGELDFNVADNALRVPVRTLRRNPKAGGYYYNMPLDISTYGFAFSVERTIPSGNSDLGTSIIFFPESAEIDVKSGLPNVFIRYFKRAKVEVVEYKHKDNKPKLLWARNKKVDASSSEIVSFSISRKKIAVIIQDSLVFSDDNPAPQYTKLKAGLWASTKGNTHGGGNLKFDRICIESLSE